ncbi:MAG TPA: hypothetical protein VFS50_14520 [Meiothermus sp.]|nr:hypothetical protein [Meiothermus sp.]
MALLLREAHTEALAAKALEVHRRLCAGYKRPIPFFSDHDPLSQLVGNLLSHRSKNHHTGRAFRAPLERFGTWEAVQNAPVEAVQEAIQGVTWPEQKAPRIQAMLREITRRVRKLELDFLGQMTIPQARHWLERLSGVDPKTSAATLLFSRLRMPALPVDSHHRVALRLGLLPEGTPVGPAHSLLEQFLSQNWSAQQVYDHHEVFMLHGKRCCYFHDPACKRAWCSSCARSGNGGSPRPRAADPIPLAPNRLGRCPGVERCGA